MLDSKTNFELLDSVFNDYDDDECEVLPILKFTVQLLSSWVCLGGVLGLLTALWLYFDFYPVPSYTLTTGLVSFSLFGIFCILIASYGCYVTKYQYRFIMVILIVILLGVIVAILAIYYFVWVDRATFYKGVETYLETSFRAQTQNINDTESKWYWYYLQVNYKCCGINSSVNYEQYNVSLSMGCCREVPLFENVTYMYDGVKENSNAKNNPNDRFLNDSNSTNVLMLRPHEMRFVFDCTQVGYGNNTTTTFVKGCLTQMESIFEDHWKIMAAVALVIASIMLVTTIILCLAYCIRYLRL